MVRNPGRAAAPGAGKDPTRLHFDYRSSDIPYAATCMLLALIVFARPSVSVAAGSSNAG
jgi:hypothetical protein